MYMYYFIDYCMMYSICQLEDEIDFVDFFYIIVDFFIGLLKVIKFLKNDFMFDL